MKTIKLLSAVGIIAMTFSSCQKGDTGPAGTNGTNGVANISSNIYSITPGSWSNPNTGVYAVNISDAAIGNAGTDGVEVFVSTTANEYLGLPTTNLLVSGDQMYYVYTNGSIAIGYNNTTAPTSTVDIKVVVIPPAMIKQHPNTNWNDYNQLKAIMGIQK